MTKSVLAFASILLVLACFTGRARAQPAPATIAPPSSATPLPAPATFGPPSQLAPAPALVWRPEPPREDGHRLEEGTALSLALAGSIASWGLFYVGMQQNNASAGLLGLVGTFVAPTMGHWYAGSGMTRGLAVRLAAGTAMVLSIGYLLSCEDECPEKGAVDILIGSLVVDAIGTLDDIITAPLAVRKHNERIESLGLAPMVGNHSAGLAIGGRF